MNRLKSKMIFIFSIFLSWCEISHALPSFQRLWERKYGYKTSCMLCHSKGGGSQLSAYGEDFQRFGMNPKAFELIEKRDSDNDGFSNIVEIKAKSNPGDPRSTPEKPTEWLSQIRESALPIDELKTIFPKAKKFSLLEGTLFPDQIKAIEKILNDKLSESDAVPTFYFAVDDKQARIGVALFSTSSKNSEKLIVGIGADLTGKITNVVLIKNKLNDALKDGKFLAQFKGKNSDASLQIKKDIQPASADLILESTEVAETVKKSLLIISGVFNKEKKL